MARKSTKKEDILDSKVDEVIVEEADGKKYNEVVDDATETEASQETNEEPSTTANREANTDGTVSVKDSGKHDEPTHYTSKTFGYSWNGVEMDF